MKFFGKTDLFFNPLDLSFTSLVEINDISIFEAIGTCKVREFRIAVFEEYTRYIDNTKVCFTDYVFKDLEEFKLRAIDDKLVLLRKFDSFPYCDEFNDVMTETEETKCFKVVENEKEDNYERLNDMDVAWAATKSFYPIANGIDAITTKHEVSYWDFFLGDTFLFIEKDGETGWFTMWKGCVIDQCLVSIL